MMQKAAASAADEVFLDLEDAVAPSEKAAARGKVVEAIKDLDWGSKIVSVRINDLSTAWAYRDLIEVVEGAGDRLDTVIVPKVTRVEDVVFVDTLLTQLERALGLPHRIGVEVLIETASGMANVEAIARASDRLESLIFGPGDYAASVGVPTLSIGGHAAHYPGHFWHYPLSRVVVAAKAAGLDALDGPYDAYRDEEGLREGARLARALGCDGKMAIHPDQIEPLNQVFSPTPEEIAWAQRIADRYRAATEEEGLGAVTLDGRLIDAVSLKLADRVLEKARRIGQQPSA